MTTRLGPALTGLDYRILHNVPRHNGIRARQLADILGEDPGSVRQILRGLQRFGYVSCAGGWWRRT